MSNPPLKLPILNVNRCVIWYVWCLECCEFCLLYCDDVVCVSSLGSSYLLLMMLICSMHMFLSVLFYLCLHVVTWVVLLVCVRIVSVMLHFGTPTPIFICARISHTCDGPW